MLFLASTSAFLPPVFRCRKNWPSSGPAALLVYPTRPRGRSSVSESADCIIALCLRWCLSLPLSTFLGLHILWKTSPVFFLSPVLLFLFILLIPKLSNCSTACHWVCHIKIFCVSETVPSVSLIMRFPSGPVLHPLFSNLLPWFLCFIPCPSSLLVSPLAFSAAYWPTSPRCPIVSTWLKANLSDT